tara:strand:+ start:100 stop:981 length:882 start_codon:yes stop_codon:yes gene_type:complete
MTKIKKKNQLKTQNTFSRPFLKWAGSKYQILDTIFSKLPEGNRLIEPFTGSGAVFLNSKFSRYLVNDINVDLVNLYKSIQLHGERFITDAQKYFTDKNNNEKIYYKFRERFNSLNDIYEKSCLFLYLNRHGYNGLVRYNSQGRYNVPFGRYKKPYFPFKELVFFYTKSKKITFTSLDFKKIMSRARRGNIVYADPPYIPLNSTSNFTSYSANTFGVKEQKELAYEAMKLSKRGVAVLISNHDTPFAREIYREAKSISSFLVQRYISCYGEKRSKALELLAFYEAKTNAIYSRR